MGVSTGTGRGAAPKKKARRKPARTPSLHTRIHARQTPKRVKRQVRRQSTPSPPRPDIVTDRSRNPRSPTLKRQRKARSVGQTITRTAKQRRKVLRRRRSVARALLRREIAPVGTSGTLDLKRGLTIDRKSYRRAYGHDAPKVSDLGRRYTSAEAKILAPALKALEQTQRPVHGLAGGTKAAIRGENIPKAVGRGLSLKDRTYFSDVLKEAGAPKGVQSVGGFALDVAADPTTYLSLGTSVPAKQAIKKTGEAYAKRAAKAGMSKAGVETVRRAAEKRAAGRLADNKGLSAGVRFKGREARTSGRATASVSRKTGASKVAKRVRRSKPVQAVGTHMRPTFRPEGVGEPEFRAARQAARQSRSRAATGQRRAQQRAVALQRSIPKKDYERVIDAIEANKLSSLPGGLRPFAKRIRDDFRFMARQERQRGILGKGVRDYFPHTARFELEPSAPRPKATAKLGSSKQRTIKEPLKTIRQRSPSLFSEDVPQVYGRRASKSVQAVAKADQIKAVANQGRKLTPKAEWDTATEAVYKVEPTGLKELRKTHGRGPDLKAIGRAVEGKTSGQHVILNRQVAESLGGAGGTGLPKLRGVGRAWDRRVQGPVKTILTVPNPQYHFTNLYGDLFNAYLADTGLRSVAQSARAMRTLARREAAAKTLSKQIDPKDAGLKIGGKKVLYDDLIREAEEQGAIRTGFIGRDLPEVLESQAREMAQKLGKGPVAKRLPGVAGRAASKVHPIRGIRDLSQYREDFVRLATFIEARKKGLSPAEASDRVAKYHFDYGDLTDFERTVLRRIFPFYTFTARNTPLQAEKLFTRPGKYATLEKARQESAKAAGLPAGYEGDLEQYEQRGLPVALPGVRQDGVQQLLYPKLPATDLSRLTADPETQADFVMAMLSPIIKSPVEFTQNYNFFFRAPIDELQTDQIRKLSDGARKQLGLKPEDLRSLIPAPKQVEVLPAAVREKLGIRRYTDRRSGKKIWGWPAKLDYLLKSTPASGTAIQLGTDAKNRSGRSAETQAFSYLTGLKLGPFDPTDIALKREMREYSALQAKADNMRRQGRAYTKGGGHTREYRKVLDQIKIYPERIKGLSKKRGDKTPLFEKRGSSGSSGGSWVDRMAGGGRKVKRKSWVDQLAP